MTEDIQGKVVFVFGAPFSGKTYLISNLIHLFPVFKVVNYELYFTSGKNYFDFYTHVKDLEHDGNYVISESVNNYVGRKHKWCPYYFQNRLNILCKPSLSEHESHYAKYKKVFGVNATNSRTGGSDIISLRSNVKVPQDKFMIFNGHNLEEIAKAVKTYVLVN